MIHNDNHLPVPELDMTDEAVREASTGDRVKILLRGVYGRTWVPGTVTEVRKREGAFCVDVEGMSPTWLAQHQLNGEWVFDDKVRS